MTAQFIEDSSNGILRLRAASWAERGIDHGFFGTGLDLKRPDSAERLDAAFPGPPLALLTQVHGVEIAEAGGSSQLARPRGDAWISSSGVPLRLGIVTADCYPVLLHCFKTRVTGSAHCGWRGAVGGIVPRLIEKMLEIGASQPSLEMLIGPGAGANLYEIGEEVAAQFEAAAASAHSALPAIRQADGKLYADLPALLLGQAASCGITTNKIGRSGQCTLSDLRFFSHRRQGAAAGRQLSYVCPAVKN